MARHVLNVIFIHQLRGQLETEGKYDHHIGTKICVEFISLTHNSLWEFDSLILTMAMRMNWNWLIQSGRTSWISADFNLEEQVGSLETAEAFHGRQVVGVEISTRILSTHGAGALDDWPSMTHGPRLKHRLPREEKSFSWSWERQSHESRRPSLAKSCQTSSGPKRGTKCSSQVWTVLVVSQIGHCAKGSKSRIM